MDINNIYRSKISRIHVLFLFLIVSVFVMTLVIQLKRTVSHQKFASDIQAAVLTSPATYYISPNGNDSNSGLSTGLPFKTFTKSISSLQSGDTLIVMDGTYQKNTTGLPVIDCNITGKGVDGTSQNPITIRAENERQAYLQSDGSQSALNMQNCSFWRLIGLRGSSADLPTASGGHQASVFQIHSSTDITLQKILSSNNNRYFNDHLYELAYNSRILIEDSEGYQFNRHAYSVYQDHNDIIRRSYAQSRDYGDIPGGYVSNQPSGGDEAFVFYWTSDSIAENVIAQGNTQGFQVHGGPDVDNVTPMGQNNKFLGSIYIGNQSGTANNGAKLDTRIVNSAVWPSKNNLYQNVLIMNTSSAGIFLEGAVNARLENVTFYNLNDDGVQSKDGSAGTGWCDNAANGCNFSIVNSLVYNSNSYGITVRNNTNRLIEYSNVYSNRMRSGFLNYNPAETINDSNGYIQNSLSIAPTNIDISSGYTPAFVNASSNMKGIGKNGADIGANVLYKYQDGVQTNELLWNPSTGAFPCGAIVGGMNDIPGSSCFDVHTVLNISPSMLPSPSPTPTPTSILTVTPTDTPIPTLTYTPTPISTLTPTLIPTNTLTPTPPDTINPTVSITSPVNGAVVARNKTTTIAATASDNRGVTRVEFYVNNALRCTDTTASYTCAWFVPSKRNATYTLRATAFDAAGNSSSHTITVRSN